MRLANWNRVSRTGNVGASPTERLDDLCLVRTRRALAIAERLARHPKVVALRYPGLASHPAHRLAQTQMTSGGSLIALTLADKAAAERFIEGCTLMRASTSFGGVHTCAERRARWGDAVPDGFIRISVGCEPTEVLVSEVERALDAT